MYEPWKFSRTWGWSSIVKYSSLPYTNIAIWDLPIIVEARKTAEWGAMKMAVGVSLCRWRARGERGYQLSTWKHGFLFKNRGDEW